MIIFCTLEKHSHHSGRQCISSMRKVITFLKNQIKVLDELAQEFLYQVCIFRSNTQKQKPFLIPTILGPTWLGQVEIKRNFQIVWLNPKIFKNFKFLAKSAIFGNIWPFLQHLVDKVGNTKLITRRLPLSSLKNLTAERIAELWWLVLSVYWVLKMQTFYLKNARMAR